MHVNGANIRTLIKAAMLPCIAAATFAAAPAQAVSVTASSPAATSLSSNTTAAATTGLTKKQIKQQRKLAKKCAKLNSKKLKAKKRAKLMAMCRTSSASVTTELPSQPSSSSNAGGDSNNAGGSGAIGGIIAASPTLFIPSTNGTGPSTIGSDQNSESDQNLGGESQQVPTFVTFDEPRAVPEPGSLALLGAGLLGLGLARRRRAL